MIYSEARMKRRQARDLPTVHGRAAGVDIGSQFHVVAVSGVLSDAPVQTFSSFTGDLHRLADWLEGLEITTVAMESTGIYWIPLFEILEARGLEVLLVNARHVKQVPGRKTDVNDAQWLQQLHQYDLLRGSFRPARQVAALRAYLRHRERLLAYAASHVQHMQKALRQMNIQLHHVLSDITGATGMAILRSIVSARPGSVGDPAGQTLQGHGRNRGSGSDGTLPARTLVRVESVDGVVRFLSGQDGRMRSGHRDGSGTPGPCWIDLSRHFNKGAASLQAIQRACI